MRLKSKKVANMVALMLPSAGDATKALQRALKFLAPNGQLRIVQLPGGTVPSTVSSWMIYLGFMGDRPSEDYLEEAMGEYNSRVQERLDELRMTAEDKGYSCNTEILKGNLLRTVWKWVRRNEPEVIVMALPEIIDPERDKVAKVTDILEKRYSARLYRV